jgi:hypothetical protein
MRQPVRVGAPIKRRGRRERANCLAVIYHDTRVHDRSFGMRGCSHCTNASGMRSQREHARLLASIGNGSTHGSACRLGSLSLLLSEPASNGRNDRARTMKHHGLLKQREGFSQRLDDAPEQRQPHRCPGQRQRDDLPLTGVTCPARGRTGCGWRWCIHR